MSQSKTYLNALIEGDNKIISEIYRKFYPKVASYIRTNRGSEEEIQDVFYRLVKYIVYK